VALQPADSPAAGPARWCLRVSDTGVGLPADFEARRGQSLGLQLAADLAGQIGGALIIEPGPGAAFSVTFPVEATYWLWPACPGVLGGGNPGCIAALSGISPGCLGY
jgi:hypothetical protein